MTPSGESPAYVPGTSVPAWQALKTMNCPQCGYESCSVIASESTHGGEAQRRRRECDECGFRFTTYEHTPWDRLQVQKRDGTLEDYRTEKLRSGIETAIIDTDVNGNAVDTIINQIESTLREEDGEIVSSEKLGNLVADELLERNEVAYMRFVSVFQGFSRPEQFERALEQIRADNGNSDIGANDSHTSVTEDADSEPQH